MANEAEVSSYYAELAAPSGAEAGVASLYLEYAGPIPIGEASVGSYYAELSGTTGGEANVASMYIEIAQYIPEVSVNPIESITLAVELHVVPIGDYNSLTDKYNTQEAVTGWIWDRRRLETVTDDRGQYTTTLGGHTVGLKDGTHNEWWQSGTLSEISYLDPVVAEVPNLLHTSRGRPGVWTPRVSTGEYSVEFDGRPLFSDYSYTGAFANDQTEFSLMFKNLRDDAVHNTVSIALWKRDADYTIYKYWDFQYVDEFTGELDEAANARLETVNDAGEFLTDNLATRKYEFTIVDNTVYLNGNWFIDKTFTTDEADPTPPVEFTNEFLDDYGDGQEQGRDILLNYLPVQPGTVKVWVVDPPGVITEWTQTDDLGFSDVTDQHYEVDHDLGIITMGGYEAPSLRLAADINEFDTEIQVLNTDGILDLWPDRGVLIIGDEHIAYYEKTYSGFAGCVRAWGGTVPEVHTLGTEVAHRKMGLGTLGRLYVEFKAVPRIQYEVTDHTVRTANKSLWLNISPLNNVETNNILQIYPGDISLDHITLETDSPFLGGDLYGPVYYGSDVSRLTATAYDAKDNPIQDIDLTIGITDGSGYLNGSLNQFTESTNSLGEIYSFYNHPLTRDSIEFVASSVVHDGVNTVMTIDQLGDDVDIEDLWVFQVLKHDKLVGTTGLPLVVSGSGAAVAPYGNYYLDLEGILPEEFRDGFVYLVIAGVKYYRTIVWLENRLDGDDMTFTRIYLDSSITGANGTTVYLYEPQAVEWVPALLNGTRFILYEWTLDAEHPLTGQPGAYLPLKPDSIDGTTLTFNNRLLPIPDSEDLDNNLGAYVVVAPSKVTLQAWGRDPASGRLVLSNEIRLDLLLPNFLVGVDFSGALPVPYGWKFATEEFNIGSGIGGANFITINPSASGIHQFAMMIEV